MLRVRQTIGGLGNLMFKDAYLWAQFRDGNIPDIYVQDEKYFTKYRNEIRQRYSHGIGSIDKIAIHIRRGDYLKAAQFHTNLWDTDYYQKAISLFPEGEFLVFCHDNQDEEVDTADYNWCVQNVLPLLGGRGKMNTPSEEETDDLNKMASCKSIIMANSSFSWWAAYLGEHEKVVCPAIERWFTDGQKRVGLLEEWTKI